MLLYLVVANYRGVLLSELPLKGGVTFKTIVHDFLETQALPTEDSLTTYNAGE